MRFLICSFALLAVAVADAQNLKVIYNFGSNANDPIWARELDVCAVGKDGAFFTTSSVGGIGNYGCIYKITSAGALTLLHSFKPATEGDAPMSGMTLGSDGNFYGACYSGGTYGVGTLWKIAPDGTFTVLHQLQPDFGSYPISPPVQGKDGNFYGVTDYVDGYQFGEFYKLAPTGTYTPLYNFKTNYATVGMMASGLIAGSDGNFYGTTFKGGKNYGTVFKATPTGTVTSLHIFDGTNGATSYNIMQGADGNLYGTCYVGGPANYGCVYKLTTSGDYTVLHMFKGTDGATPVAGVVQGKDGYLYGATKFGGAANRGAIYRLKPDGTNFQLLWSRSGNLLEGMYCLQTPVFGLDGVLYGNTYQGGTKNSGVFYSLDVTKIAYPAGG